MSAVAAGALAGAIPNIFGGFASFPNTIATALLVYQSEAIGYGFGIKFQVGKREIGAMSNDTFNALTLDSLGALLDAHNQNLIDRMQAEMPKWIAIQQHYIEAGVQVEVMKANRTPSAWAEIITAFANASGEQIGDSLEGLPTDILSSLLSGNPILALAYYLQGNANPEDPPSEEDLPPGTPPPPPPAENAEEEHQAVFGYNDGGQIKQYVGITGNLSEHNIQIGYFETALAQGQSYDGVSVGATSNLINSYQGWRHAVYGQPPA